MSEKKIPMLTNEDEILLLKGAFAGNEAILLSIRSLLLGFPVPASDALAVKEIFRDRNLKLAFRKKLYPILSPDSLIGEGGDYWFGTDTEIVGKPPEVIAQIVDSKHEVFKMFTKAMHILDNPFDDKMSIDFKSVTEDPFQISLLARNKYISAVGTALMMVKIIAGQKNETVEQAKKRLLNDSTK